MKKRIIALLMAALLVCTSSCTIVYESKDTSSNQSDSSTDTDTQTNAATDRVLTPVAPPEDASLSQIAAVCQETQITAEEYYFYVYYIAEMAVAKYGMYLPYYGGEVPDYSYTLKEQYFMTDTTWYDMVLQEVEYYIIQITSLAKAAKDANITLSETDKEKIAESVKETKLPQNVDFVSEAAITSCLSTIRLADKYYYSHLPTTHNITDDDIMKEYEDNKAKYSIVDLKYLQINYSDDATVTNENGTAKLPTKKQAQEYADRLIATAGSDEFETIVAEFYRTFYPDYKEEDIEHEVKAAYMKDQVYFQDYTIFEWAFDEKRTAGETTCIDDAAADALHVAVLLKPMAPNESKTATVRHILVEKESEANDLLALFEASDKTEASFAALAEKHTIDTGSQFAGGMYENFAKGTMVEPFETWSFDETRVTGDTGIVKTDYGYHIMYYVSQGMPAYLANAKKTLIDTKTSEAYSALTKDVKVEMTEGFLDKLAI